MKDISEHILLVNELNSDLHAGSDVDSILKKACDRLSKIHHLHFIDSYFLEEKPDGSRFLKFSYSTLERKLIKRIEKISGLNISSFEIPIFEGSIYEKIHSELQPIEFKGKKAIIRVLEDMVEPEKKLLRKIAPKVAGLVGSKYIYVVPLIANNQSIGQIGFNSDKPFDELTREALNMVVSKIANIIALKKSIKQIEDNNRELSILNTAKDKLFSIISHDLKSPFNIILGYSGLLKKKFEKLDREEILSMIDLVNDSAAHANELMDNLLTWALSQRDFVKIEKRECDLFDIVDDVLQKQEIFGQSKQISLINNVSKNMIILADVDMLTLVLRNLVSNAHKFTNNGGKIEISAKSKKRSIEILVKDNGMGMSENIRQGLFQTGAFSSTKGTENESGSGLGLQLCKDVVEALQGKIKVKSELGKGSEFIISIPQ